MDEMEWTKIVGGVCGALLLYLVLNTAADALYHVGADDGHGSAHASKVTLPASIYALDQEIDSNESVAEGGPKLDDLLASADPAKGKKVFSKCKACHKLDAGQNGVGPTLYQIIDRPIGTEPNYTYSKAMANFGGNWGISNMDIFLAKPKDLIPGTKMSFAGLKKAKDRANIIAYLQSLQ